MSTQAAVVLGAGEGTRMRSRTPKVLHPVCGEAMIGLVLDAASATGFESTVVVVGSDSQEIRETLGDDVGYAVQHEPLGTGHALLQARPLLQGVDTVAVIHGDVPLIRPETLRSMLRLHAEREACITLLTARVASADDLGRIVRDGDGSITAIVEDSEADDETRAIAEVNGGAYCFSTAWLWSSLESLAPSPQGELYLTDLISAAVRQGMTVASFETKDLDEVLGINTRVHLSMAEAALRRRIRERWMLSGVTMPDPVSVYIDAGAELGQDTVVLPNTHVRGASTIGRECEIGPNTIVDSSRVGDRCRVVASVIEGATVEDDVTVGPFGHLRPGSFLETGVHIGNFAEVTRSRLGRGSRSGHFSYIGDAEVGTNVNVGAGTVTCNYDGTAKHATRIEDDALIGSSSMLVAPVTVGARAATGAGAVVTRDVPPDQMAVGVPARSRPKKTRRSQE